MPEDTRETTIAGTRYVMKLLGGEKSMRAGFIVTGPAFRAIDQIVEKIDFSKGLDKLSKDDLKVLPSVMANLLDGVGFEGLVILTRLFAESTTVYVPSGAIGDTALHPVPMTNQLESHFTGKWPAQLAWLGWAVYANGFLDVSSLDANLQGIAAAAKALFQSRKASTGSSGDSSTATT